MSIGSNVGLSYTASDLANQWSSGDSTEIAVRVPAGLNAQLLPGTWDPREGGWTWPFRWMLRHVGLHGGIQLVDLGQFLRNTSGDGSITCRASSLPAPRLGLLIGTPERAFTITGHVSYAPTLVDNSPALWRYGISVGYYVPFFDLN